VRRRRSALPLPRYTLHKRLKTGWGYFFNVPIWARKRGCTVQNEPLGTDYDAAVLRAEKVLLPAFDSWRTGGDDESGRDRRGDRNARLDVSRVPANVVAEDRKTNAAFKPRAVPRA